MNTVLEINPINTGLLSEKRKAIIICDANKAFHFVFPLMSAILTKAEHRFIYS
jgi:hypothetical protein